MFGYMWRLALRESNASLEVHLANLSHILVEIWETPYLKYRILHSVVRCYTFIWDDIICKNFQSEPDLIFVTNLTNQVGGEKICHVEKFQLSMRDDCGKI